MSITALIILDGYGVNECNAGNAICADGSRYVTQYMQEFAHTTLFASGMEVGLPRGQMGNSEVGHLNIGAGRVVYQDFTRVTKSIEDGDFFENPAFKVAIDNAKKHGSKLHFMGLCSDGGVHSHLEHLYAFLELCKKNELKDVFVHCFMDGRDVPPSSGKGFIEQLEAQIERIGCGKIATVMGRYYAMDRDNRWERVQKAYEAMTYGQGEHAPSAAQAMQNSYDNGVVDEFVLPTVVAPEGTVGAHDSVIFFNFRPDRAREISRTFIDPAFAGFERKAFFPLTYVCLTQYDKTFAETFDDVHIAYAPQSLKNTLGEYLADNGLKQLRIAETEKYAHVTFFFNGGIEAPNEGEDRALIASPKVATYDLQPEMSAYEVAAEAVKRIESGVYDVMILNFANADMVGHTGIMAAAVKAIHAVDECVHIVVEAIRKVGGKALITADHGNSDQMIDPVTGGAFTAHTTNPVPLIYIDDERKDAKLKSGGKLADLAPTILDIIDLEKPEEMTGSSLIQR